MVILDYEIHKNSCSVISARFDSQIEASPLRHSFSPRLRLVGAGSEASPPRLSEAGEGGNPDLINAGLAPDDNSGC